MCKFITFFVLIILNQPKKSVKYLTQFFFDAIKFLKVYKKNNPESKFALVLNDSQ